MEDGQHRDDGTPAPNSGQRTRPVDRRSHVGQHHSGGEIQNGPVPASNPCDDISTGSGVERNRQDRHFTHHDEDQGRR